MKLLRTFLNSAMAIIFIFALTLQINSQDKRLGSDLWCMEFLDDVSGITIGGAGTIRQTTDGGISWQDKSSGTVNTLKKTAILTDENIIVVGLNGTILKTTDQGTSWSTKDAGISTDLYSVSFGGRLSEVGIAVGDNGTIIRSTDSGESWSTVLSGNGIQKSIRYTAVSLGSENNGIVAGDGGTIMLTSNGGLSWYSSPSFIPNVNFKFAIMVSESIGFVTGENGTIIKTTDAGQSWQTINTGVSNTLYRIRFADDINAVSVGTEGTILKTTDGGISWINETSGTSNNLNCLFVVDDVISYTGGQDGIILKTTDGGTTWFGQGGYNVSSQISNNKSVFLSGYPNPSNPVTNISYYIPGNSFVTVKIYNILGKELNTLVSENLTQGTYTVVFNGSNLSSGMYFCRLTVENNFGITAKTMKIILVK